jgi:glycosyltransferase involved in cell wall biosynthesis
MLLIDASNIREGGGSVLLQYLLRSICDSNIEYKVIVNSDYFSNVFENAIKYEGRYLFSRNSFLKKQIHLYKPTVVLAFGNFPPSFAIKGVMVITYVQNALYTLDYRFSWFSVKDNFLIFAKSIYFLLNKKNSDIFCFQTNHVLEKFKIRFKLERHKLRKIPFYQSNSFQDILIDSFVEKGTYIYISSSDPHKNHLKLLEAWELLLHENISPPLYLTLPVLSDYSYPILKKIEELNIKGCKILNLGSIGHNEILQILSKIEYCVFPTLIETIGLGLLEAASMNKKIICSDIACLKEIIKPSLIFDPNSSFDIFKAIKISLDKDLCPAEVLLENKVQELIKILK